MKKSVAADRFKRNQNRKNPIKTKLKYVAGILTLSGLIGASLWLPQVFFEVQDNFQYGDVSLMRQEQMDILTLNAGYEPSLYRRLANFAEGLAEQRRYYVDMQNREVTEEIQSFLQSGEGLHQNIWVMNMLGSIFLTDRFLEKEITVISWKQYLIYSDDYAQGVNFILWLFEMITPEKNRIFVLMDAQDYTVYAVKMAQGEKFMLKDSQEVHITAAYYARTNLMIWAALNICYGIFDMEDAVFFDELSQEIGNKFYEPIQGAIEDSSGNRVEFRIPYDSEGVLCGADGNAWYGRTEDGEKYFQLLFHDNFLTFILETPDLFRLLENGSFGIREIYELIPEFQEFG